MVQLSKAQIDFLRQPQFAHVGTVGSGGQPQVTAVWIDTDGERVIFNTSQGRLKARNLSRDPRVSISITDAQDPYRRLVIQGRVAEMVEGGAVDHINFLNQKYHGNPVYPLPPGQVRLIVKVDPERVSGNV